MELRFDKQDVEFFWRSKRYRLQFEAAETFEEFVRELEKWELTHLTGFKGVFNFDEDERRLIDAVGTQFGTIHIIAQNSDLCSILAGVGSHSFAIKRESRAIIPVSNVVPEDNGRTIDRTFLSRSLRNSFRLSVRQPRGILVDGELRALLYDVNDFQTPAQYIDLDTGRCQVLKLDTSLKSLCNISKVLQVEHYCRFWELGASKLLEWDLRSSTNSPVSQRYYKSTPNFTAMAVTGDGSLVTGSKSGVVRLYSPKNLKHAIIQFPSIRLNILHVDVTYNGELVLVTTENMLIIFSTTSSDAGVLDIGFKKRLGKKITFPMYLCLNAEDEQLLGGRTFTSGRFDHVTRAEDVERRVMAWIANCVFVWDLDKIMKSHHCFRKNAFKICRCYQKIHLADTGTDGQFLHNNYRVEGKSPMLVVTKARIRMIL